VYDREKKQFLFKEISIICVRKDMPPAKSKKVIPQKEEPTPEITQTNEETISDDEPSIIEDVNQPKKRGRKPKTKLPEEDEKKAGPKKRGRRPKDKTYTVISNYKEVPAEIEDDNVILHLPIETDIEVNNDKKIDTSGMLKYDPNLNEPLPYEPMDSMKSGFALISDKIQEKISELNEIEEEEVKVKDVVESKCNSDEVYIRDIGFEEDLKDHFRVIKKAKILKLFASDEGNKEWELSSNCCCFHCTENFQTVPIGIPVRFFRGRFVCRDIFCSFNCAAAYIFSGFNMRYHFKKWEYYSLLCLMATKINNIICEKNKENCLSIKVKLADDRNLLKKFGGPYTIEQYRENFYILDSSNNILYPPITCMYPQAEISHYINIPKSKAQAMSNESKSSFGDSKCSMADLRLKRDKPLIQKKNTLEEYMSLKIN